MIPHLENGAMRVDQSWPISHFRINTGNRTYQRTILDAAN